MDHLQYLQWNCRGLETKVHLLFLFLTKEKMDIVFLNEVKKCKNVSFTKKTLLQQKQKQAVFMGLLSLHKGIKVKEVRTIISRKNSNGQALEIIGVNLDNWCKLGNSPNQNLSFNELFETNL